MVGPTEEQCIERAQKEGWTLGKSQGNFRANSKALAEGEGQGIAKVLFNKDTGKVVAVHIIGLHAADLIQECANAVAAGTTVQELSMMVVSIHLRCALLRYHCFGSLIVYCHHSSTPTPPFLKLWMKLSKAPLECLPIKLFQGYIFIILDIFRMQKFYVEFVVSEL